MPRIAISGASMDTPSFKAIVARVSEAGGEPLVICDHAGRDPAADFAQISALVVMGNDFDIDPEHYIHRYPDDDPRRSVHPSTKSEKGCEKATARAEYENAIMRMALAEKMPMLCICGGMQRLNVLCGGTLHQHVPDMTGHDKLMQNLHGADGATPTIPIVIEPATRMAMIAKRVQMGFVKSSMPGMPTVIMENSFRHQSIDMVGHGLRACALSDVVRRADGTSDYLIEAIEPAPDGPYAHQFLIGVQWHPEFGASEIGGELLSYFIEQARAWRDS